MADPELTHRPSSRSLRQRRLTNSDRLLINTIGIEPELQAAPEPDKSGEPLPEAAAPPSAAIIASPTPADPLARHPDLWFADGSIILRAEGTLFRVHMSQLSRHSLFFRDMFSFPQPDGTPGAITGGMGSGDVVEGCPVLLLHDPAEDVQSLLRAIYDGPAFGDNGRADFRRVAGVLRLATKYFVDKLRGRAADHLALAWPGTLKAWDLREDIARAFELETGTPRGFRYPSPIAVINLARQVDAPELLPAAFYDLSRYHYAQIFEAGEDEPLGGAREAHSLSTEDMQRLALGKEAVSHSVTALIQNMASGSESPRHLAEGMRTHHRPRKLVCTTASACRKDFAELVELATQHYLFDRERGCADPLYVAEELGQLKSAEFSECEACARSLEAWAARERERMWRLIPSWFRL